MIGSFSQLPFRSLIGSLTQLPFSLIHGVANFFEVLTDRIVLLVWGVLLFPFKALLQAFWFLNGVYSGSVRYLIANSFLEAHAGIYENFVFSFFLTWQFMVFFPVTVLSFIFNELEAMDCFEAVMQNAARFLKHLCITTCGILVSSLHFYVFYSIFSMEWHSPMEMFHAISEDTELCSIIRLIGTHKIATGIYLTRENKIAEVLDAQPDDNIYMRVFIKILNFILRRLNFIDGTRKCVYRPWIIETEGFTEMSDFNYSMLAACVFVFFSEVISHMVPSPFGLCFQLPMYGYFLFASFLFPTRLLVGLLGLCWSMLGLSSYFLVLVYMAFFVYPNSTS